MDLYQVILLIVAALNLVAVPFVKSLMTRIDAIEKHNQRFALEVTKEYVTKDDMKEHVSTHLASIEDKINSLESLIKQSLRQG